MKRLLLFFTFLIFTSNFNAQLDREHWFAPMVDGVGNPDQYQSLYLSTGEPTPFKVDIYNNNVVIATVTISKNNPVKYAITDRSKIITTSANQLFKPVPMGLYLKGEKPFFASLRFSVLNHGEMQTSKGSAAKGTEFRAVVAPMTTNASQLNFMNSIMATEDNTTVTVSNFNPSVRFTDGQTRTQITFTLNKGQSYIIEGKSTAQVNYTGYIGAKIISNKPIVIANGNFNGQYAGPFNNSSDTLMDQGVPTSKLGQEFVLMKGNGNLGNNMEKGLIVATEDNTKIYLNNNPTPVTTLNAGQYYTTPESAYINQGFGHYNQYIKSDKNIYVYQLLAGDNGTSEVATGGMNYIPPLSCYLPKKIDEIGRIDENEYSSNGVPYSLTVPTKLNIITAKGATINVTRNMVPLTLDASNGPFNVSGTNDWVTYSIPNITGNIAIFSTEAVTAGISAGNDAMGYGGYFAGFSFTPAIIKREGECLPGVKLEVTADFASYLWLMKNPDGTYSPAPGVNNTNIYEPTQAGIYAVKIQQGTCPEIQTQDFKFYNCTTYTDINYDLCSTVDITPSFVLSSQTVNPASIVIDTPPTLGTVSITGGILKYTANPNAKGTDTFKYTFCGNGQIPDCETVQATLHLNQIEKYDVTLSECSSNGTATYDLSTAAVTPETGITKKYYKTLNGAQNQTPGDVIANFTNYTTPDTTVYVRMSNAFGCFDIAAITLQSKIAADVQPALYTVTHCDEEIDGVLDGVYKVDLNSITPIVIVNNATGNFNVKYYDSPTKANAGGTDNLTGIFSFTNNTDIWIRVESTVGCPPVIEKISLKIGQKLTLQNTTVTAMACDNNNAGHVLVNLNDYTSLFFNGTITGVKFYKTLPDAQNNTNAIANPSIDISAATTFYYRIQAAGFCASIGTLTLDLGHGTPSPTLLPNYTICENSSVTVDVGLGYTHIFWPHNGSTAQTQVLTPGTYTVELTNATGCVYKQTVTISGYPIAQPKLTQFNGEHCDEDFDGKIQINFSTEITPILLDNPQLYTIKYYKDQNLTQLLPNLWTYTAATTVYMKIESPYCPTVVVPLDFSIGARIALDTPTYSTQICDNDLDGVLDVNLGDFKTEFTQDPSVVVSYFKTIADARKNINPLNNPVSVTGTQTFYLRFSKAGVCSEVASLTLKIKTPMASATLQDQTICPDALAILNAGSGFQYYKWMDAQHQVIKEGNNVSNITVGVGTYFVELTYNGCPYTQEVKVTAVDLPEITSVIIEGTTVTVMVTGGTPPYQYSLDGITWQNSNIFTNVSYGDHTVYVISEDHCAPVTEDFTIIRILNVITPNGDGYNDVLDYSGLKSKQDVLLKIFDRNGSLIFTGTSSNNYSWDGKQNGKPIPTASYWYILQWKDPGSGLLTEQKGWILVKNRD